MTSPGRFTNPYPQFFDSSPNVYSGGLLYFYAAGTSTPLDTYSNTGLTVANTNPVVLGSAGRSTTDIYMQDLYYKVVFKDSSGNTIWTADNFYSKDPTKTSVRLTGSGSPNGVVAGTAGSVGILPTEYWDYTNSILYICTTTGTTSTAVWTALNASTATASFSPPQGRLTPTSAVPVITTGVTSGTSVYYTPFIGNLVPLYNGSLMIPTEFSELTLSLVSSHSLNTVYDVFIFSNSGVVTIATGPAWSTSTAGAGARGSGAATTQLTRIKGLYVNAVSITGRNGATTYTIAANKGTYVGSIFIDGTAGQVTCHTVAGQSRKFGIWNAFNKVPITLLIQDSTSTWSYNTATWRPSNNSTSNVGSVLVGLPDAPLNMDFTQNILCSTAGAVASGIIAFGVNDTANPTGKVGKAANNSGSGTTNTTQSALARYTYVPAIGVHGIYSLEEGNAAGTITWNGGTDMLMTLQWLG